MDAPSLAPGTAFGRYVIAGTLGEGGMGVVYRARDSHLQRTVALKLLRPREGTDPAVWLLSKARLLREAQAAASLSHRAIVTVFDVGELDGLPFLAMELIEGRTLRERMATPPGVTHGDAVGWLRTIADALGAAHAVGVVHRDIKPENVIVGDDGQVRVLDFGIARAVDASPASGGASGSSTPRLPTLTRDGAVVGTVAYMAPEQIAGEPLDGRADQFAWGVLAYELLAGRVPWAGGADAMVVLSSILTKPVIPLADVVTDLPLEVSAVVMRALSKAREDRFPTMRDLVAAWPVQPGPASFRNAVSITPAQLSKTDLASLEGAATESLPGTDPLRAPGTTRRDPRPPGGAPARRSALALGLALAGSALVGLAAVSVARSRPAPVASTVLAPRPSASTEPRAERRADALAGPPSANAEAVAAYEEGLADARDGVASAGRSFDRARTLDPRFAAASLRLAMATLKLEEPVTRGPTMEAYRQALAGRDRLTSRDRALLDALSPVLLRQPAAWGETVTQLRALVASAPDDAELTGFLGYVLLLQGDLVAADATLGAALAHDPRLASAMANRAVVRRLQGDLAGARASASECLNVSPRATACLLALSDVESVEGHCAAMEALAHRQIATTPDDVSGYQNLLTSELALREPPATLDVTQARLLAHLTPETRASASLYYPCIRAVLAGDFARCEAILGQMAEAAHGGSDVEQEVQIHAERAEVALEMGDLGLAGREAQAYVDAHAALPPPRDVDRYAIAADSLPSALLILRQAGRLRDDAFESQRQKWVETWRSRVPDSEKDVIWLRGDASLVLTETDARRALARAPAPEGIARLLAGDQLEAHTIGLVDLLAGKPAEALPLLEKAAGACSVRQHPLSIPRARYYLGLAKERTGDRTGACSDYADVLARWGHATPRSVTADEAREHRRAIGCARLTSGNGLVPVVSPR